MTQCAGICYFDVRVTRLFQPGGTVHDSTIKTTPPIPIKTRPSFNTCSRNDSRIPLSHKTFLLQRRYGWPWPSRSLPSYFSQDFKQIMSLINKSAGLDISVYHTFNDEVSHQKQHVWRCNGKCNKEPPYHGLYTCARNLPPGKLSLWWEKH